MRSGALPLLRAVTGCAVLGWLTSIAPNARDLPAGVTMICGETPLPLRVNVPTVLLPCFTIPLQVFMPFDVGVNVTEMLRGVPELRFTGVVGVGGSVMANWLQSGTVVSSAIVTVTVWLVLRSGAITALGDMTAVSPKSSGSGLAMTIAAARATPTRPNHIPSSNRPK